MEEKLFALSNTRRCRHAPERLQDAVRLYEEHEHMKNKFTFEASNICSPLSLVATPSSTIGSHFIAHMHAFSRLESSLSKIENWKVLLRCMFVLHVCAGSWRDFRRDVDSVGIFTYLYCWFNGLWAGRRGEKKMWSWNGRRHSEQVEKFSMFLDKLYFQRQWDEASDDALFLPPSMKILSKLFPLAPLKTRRKTFNIKHKIDLSSMERESWCSYRRPLSCLVRCLSSLENDKHRR